MTIKSMYDRVVNSLGSRDTAYIGASTTAREVADWDASDGSPDTDLNTDERGELRGRARDLDRNSGLARNLKTTKTDNIVGVGLQWQPTPNWRVLNRTSDWAHEFASNAKAHWNNYSKSAYFDADGEDNFAIQQRQVNNSKFTDGSAVVLPMWRERPGTIYRTCFKIIEADRLCNPNGAMDTARLANGVQRRADGTIEGYHVLNIHPGSHSSTEVKKWEYIPAKFPTGRRRFIHVYHKNRPGQTSGAAAVASVMAAFGLRTKYQLTELQAAEVSSRIAGIMETPLSDEAAQALFGGEKDNYQDMRRQWSGKLTAGLILKLPPGTQFKSHIPNRPATAYVGFMNHVSQEIGISVGLPDILSLRDWSKVNYSSARGALLECWRGFYVERSELAFQYCDPCLELWLEEAVDLGVIEAPGFSDNKSAYCDGKWLGKGHMPIDRLKHENANKIALENRTTTLLDIYAEDGEDWQEKMEQVHREDVLKLENRFKLAAAREELKKKHKIDIDPEPSPSPASANPEDPKSDEEIDEQEEKETKKDSEGDTE